MKPVNIVVLASVIAIAGRFTQKKAFDSKMVVGGAVVAIGFAVAQDAQPKIAESFAWLILASTLGAYGEDLFSVIGSIVDGTKKTVTRTGSPNSTGGGKPMSAE